MIEELYATRVRKSLVQIVSPRQRLEFSKLEIYYRNKGFILNEEFAYNLDLLTSDGKYNYVALLCADKNPVSFKFAKYAGTDKIDLIENVEFGYTSIIEAVNSVLAKLKVENRIFTKITDSRRKETPMIDPVALREAVINAFVHNDYSYGNPPVFEMYSDRFEITSNGGLGYFGTKEEFFMGRSNPKNRELMRIFKDLDFVEELGSGIRRILEKYPKDIYKFSQNYITVSFPLTKIINENVNEKEERIMKFLRINPTTTLENLSQATKLPKSTLTRYIKILKSKQLLRRIGSDKTGYWEVRILPSSKTPS